MESNRRSLVVGISIISILLLAYFLMTWQSERYDWEETYEMESEHKNVKKPYDISIINSLLGNYIGKGEMITMDTSIASELLNKEGQADNYVYIGYSPYFDSSGLDRIFEFAETGNTVFIAANNLPQNFINKLSRDKCQVNYINRNLSVDEDGDYYYEDEDGEIVFLEDVQGSDDPLEEDDEIFYDENTDEIDEVLPKTKVSGWMGFKELRDTMVHVNFYHPTLFEDQPIAMKYGSKTNKRMYNWNYIHEHTFCKEAIDFAALSYIEDFKTNYIKVPYGEGNFLIHSTPLQFTDYQLVNEEGLLAANKVFTHLTEGDIYMDRVAYNSGIKFPKRNSDETPLEYVLSQPPLKWAWYLLLATVGCYLFFRAKRKQQIVPVLETKENSSLEYIKTVGRLYFLQNDHKKLASQKMKLFLQHVRTQYSIPTNEISAEMKDRLASKSKVPIALVEEIFTRYKRLQRDNQQSSSHLTNFHFAVEEFYKKSK